MGLLPIHVYAPNDESWVPYERIFKQVGWVVTPDELPALLEKISKMSDEEIASRERLALK